MHQKHGDERQERIDHERQRRSASLFARHVQLLVQDGAQDFGPSKEVGAVAAELALTEVGVREGNRRRSVRALVVAAALHEQEATDPSKGYLSMSL